MTNLRIRLTFGHAATILKLRVTQCAIYGGTTMITMHPGEYLMMSYVEPYRLSQRELAGRLGVSTAAVSRLLAHKSDLAPALAVRLEVVFDQSAESWMTMQVAHSLAQARKAVDPRKLTPFVFDAVDAA